MSRSRLLSLGVVIIFIGFFVVFLGAFIGAESSRSTSGGGFILIGPIPIVFGGGYDSGMLAEVGLTITLVMVAVYILSFFFWMSRRRAEAEIRTESE